MSVMLFRTTGLITLIASLARAQPGSPERRERAPEPPSLEAQLSWIADATRPATCFAPMQIGLMPSAVLGLQGCADRRGDTTIYSYRSDSGRILVAGRLIMVDAKRLPALTDSIVSMLQSMYGSPTVCQVHAHYLPVEKRHLQWYRDGYTVLFRSPMTLEEMPNQFPRYVDFEIVRDFLHCGDWIYSPMRR